MGWTIIGGMLLLWAFTYAALKALALLARGVLMVGSASLKAIFSLPK